MQMRLEPPIVVVLVAQLVVAVHGRGVKTDGSYCKGEEFFVY